MIANTKWSIRFNKVAQKNFEKLDKQAQQQIQRFLRERLLLSHSPRLLGKALSGNYSDFWRYRVGDYRIVCKIEDSEFVVLIVRVAHRREIYE
jgi:mRNA interferase RelE/StbE